MVYFLSVRGVCCLANSISLLTVSISKSFFSCSNFCSLVNLALLISPSLLSLSIESRVSLMNFFFSRAQVFSQQLASSCFLCSSWLLLSVCLLVRFSYSVLVILSCEMSLFLVSCSVVEILCSLALRLVYCLNSACRSSNSFLEQILTSVSSMVSRQIPHPLSCGCRLFLMLSRSMFLFLRTSSSLELASSFLMILSQRVLTWSLAEPPCIYLQHLNGPSPSLKTVQKALPSMETPCISLVTFMALKQTCWIRLENLTQLSFGRTSAVMPTFDMQCSPSRMMISHSFGSAVTQLRMMNSARHAMQTISPIRPQSSRGGVRKIFERMSSACPLKLVKKEVTAVRALSITVYLI